MNSPNRAGIGWFWGLGASLPLGAGSALLAHTPTQTLVLSILGAASLLMPLSWVFAQLRPSRQVLLWLFGVLGNGFWMLAYAGSWVSTQTHHRPLGGATFAGVAVGVLSLCAVAAARVVSLQRNASHTAQRTGAALAYTGLAIAALGMLLVARRALSADQHVAVTLAEALITIGAALAVLQIPGTGSSTQSFAGVTLWVLVVAGGGYAVGRFPEAAGLISPALSGVLPLFR